MTAMVIDASSVVDLVRGDARADKTRRIVRDAELHAPDIVTVEVISAIARQERSGLAVLVVDTAVRSLVRFPVTRHASADLVADAWVLRPNVRIADAFYVALARTLSLPLVTSDARLGRTIQQQSLCDVRVIA